MTELPFRKPGDALPHPKVLASDQIAEALAYSQRDFSNAPRWRFHDLHVLTERMLPGDLIVLGALVGNGKTAFLMSQTSYLATQGVPVLYVPLELDPHQMRRQWAAWEAGIPWQTVARNEWDELPESAAERFDEALNKQFSSNLHFPPDRRVSMKKLGSWVQWAVGQFGVQVVVIDHFHRMNHLGNDYRLAASEAVRDLKDIAREQQVVVLCAAQLNRLANTLDRYMPPRLERLKETSALAEEADCVLMLSRMLKSDIDAAALKSITLGLKSERDYEEPGVMAVTCRKHRLRDSARDRTIKLAVENGRVGDYAHYGV